MDSITSSVRAVIWSGLEIIFPERDGLYAAQQNLVEQVNFALRGLYASNALHHLALLIP